MKTGSVFHPFKAALVHFSNATLIGSVSESGVLLEGNWIYRNWEKYPLIHYVP